MIAPLLLLTLVTRLTANTYYLRASGNDHNAGTSPQSAWRTLARVREVRLTAGDSVLLEGGQTFSGSLSFDASVRGSADRPIVIGSYGKGRATIAAGDGRAIFLHNTAGFVIRGLILAGGWDAGRQTGSTEAGLDLFNDLPGGKKLDFIRIQNVEARGFKQGGIQIAASPADGSKSGFRDVRIEHCVCHDNASAGIASWGPFNEKAVGYAHSQLTIAHCTTYNNRGIVKNDSHSGSGIVLGDVQDALIERCVAYENGDLCRHTGGGPVGIWAWDSDRVVIQHNEAYRNHTGANADGGGFDLDGGVTNSVMQYNYSHDNDGAGYLFAQFGGARPFFNNIARFNISENDGRKNGYAGFQFWNGWNGVRDCEVYHNTVFVSPSKTGGAPRAVRFMTATENVSLRNNLFVTTDGLPLIEIEQKPDGFRFEGNAYWSSGAAFKILWSGKTYDTLEAWRNATGQEMLAGAPVGLHADPLLVAPGQGGILGNADHLFELQAYRLHPNSPLRHAALALTRPPFHLRLGSHDFYGLPFPDGRADTIGAHEFPTK